MHYLFLVGGERGGVGKSMLARALTGYLITRKIEFTLFDADDQTQDLYKTYIDSIGCRLAYFAGGHRHDEAANAIFNAATKSHVVVNLPANNLRAFSDLYLREKIQEWATEQHIKMIQFFVSDGTKPSYNHLNESLKILGNSIPHIVVKNLHKSDNWDTLNPDTKLGKILEKYGARIIKMPEIPGNATLTKLVDDFTSFEEFIKDKNTGSFESARIRRFLTDCSDEFDTLGFFNAEVKLKPEVKNDNQT